MPRDPAVTTDPAPSSTSTSAPEPVGGLDGDVTAAEADPDFQAAEAGIDPTGSYANQPAFDAAAANAVFGADLARAEQRVRTAESAITRAERDIAAAEAHLSGLDASLAPLRADQQDAVLAELVAHDEFADAAVDAYIRGNDADASLLVSSQGATDHAVGQVLLRSALVRDDAAIDAYIAQRDDLEVELGRVTDELIGARQDVERLRSGLGWQQVERLLAENEVQMWSAGAHIFISGYRFPVDGPVEFGDSFGAPRMVGTEYEHWHEGTDIFAPHGTPLVAAEDGVIAKVSTGGVLGGNSLRVAGTSGYTHYYAHLSGFADGIVLGRPVRVCDVLGFGADTGNALGTSPHLHYEIQLPDGTSVNPFPVLSVAYEWWTRLGPLGVEPAPAPGG